MNSQVGESTILGIDLGSNSIGWALLAARGNPPEPYAIMHAGVRVFPIAANEEKGRFGDGKDRPAGQQRRVARLSR